jgi:hypothetical protein
MLDKTGGPISGPEELVERVHAGRLPGGGGRGPTRPRSTTSPAPPGDHPGPAAGMLDRLKEKNEDHLASRQDNAS